MHFIQVSAVANGIHLDASDALFLAHELDVVKAKEYEKEYAVLTATRLFPVSTGSRLCEMFTYGFFDFIRMAKIIADCSDNLANVGANYREQTGTVWVLGNFYEYLLQEVRESQTTGKNLATGLANAARREHDIKVNDLVFKGDK